MISYSGPIVTRAEAKASGLKRFFDGTPCVRGHICQRYALQGQCVECNNAAFRAYRAENLERERARRADYYGKTREREREFYRTNASKIRPQQRAYYARNVMTIRAKARAARLADLEHHRQIERRYREQNSERVRRRRLAWLKANPAWRKVKKHRRRAKERNAPGSHSLSDIKRIHKLQKGRCAICFQKLGERYTVDHITALSRGGSNDPSNIQLACRACNAKKWAKDPIDFARELGRLL